jgi:copper chaperone CopZ
MKVQVLFFEGCPNHEPTVRLTREVLAELGLRAEIEEVEVKNSEDVQRWRFLGSPTVLVDGSDIEPSARRRADFGFCCRTFDGSGVPPRVLLVQAFRACESETTHGHDCCMPRVPDESPEASAKGRTALWAAAGSVVSAVVASACCWLPLLLLAFGLSAAGVSAAFERVRPFFLLTTAVLLGTGFYFAYFRTEACVLGSGCPIPNPKLRRFNRTMLWVAAVVVAAVALYPNYVGLLLGNPDQVAAVDNGGLQSLALKVQGMTCEACATHIERELEKVPRVKQATVRYAERRALVTFDQFFPPSHNALFEAVKKAGYEASLAELSGNGGE